MQWWRSEPNVLHFEELQMSGYALAFMVVAVACGTGALAFTETASTLGNALMVAGGVSALFFVLALIKGRRIKFDPLMR
jgi:hypothetical protein